MRVEKEYCRDVKKLRNEHRSNDCMHSLEAARRPGQDRRGNLCQVVICAPVLDKAGRAKSSIPGPWSYQGEEEKRDCGASWQAGQGQKGGI